MYVESVNGTLAVDAVQPSQNISKGENVESINVQPVDQAEVSVDMLERRKDDMEHIRKVMQSMQESLPNTDAMFSVHSATNRIMIKLVDRTTRQVVKELPPEKTLDILAKCMELYGVMVDKKV